MDKQQARNLISETFEQPFDKDRFTRFIRDLLNRIEEAPFAYHGQFIPEAYRQYISTLERIGKFNDGKNRIDILVIRLQKETSIERARTMQRNFVAGYLQGKYGSSNEKEAALVAFVSPDEEDWRFSLVRMDYKFEQTPTGKTKVKEEFTPARRWSFLVGVNEKSHTAQSRLEKILADDENNPTLAQLEDAFNIETVTKEFFLKYRDLFIRTKEALDKVVKNNACIQADFEAKGVNTVDFAKKLLGQIVFLYFLQKKGWFGVARDADWGTGSKHFLRELFEKKHGDYKNFFNDILEPLFYEALRNDRSHDDDYYSRFNCKIPFLNGGLFDPIGGYDWVHTDIYLPDVLFSNRKTSDDEGSGILDIFDLYNFTVKEDEPLEKEVAIDPELLGKAYEKFNAIRPDNFEEYKKALKSGKKGDESKFNKQFGVYYTPREIVHYMCRQSLINYLFTELNSGTTSYEKLGDSNLDMLGNEAKKGQLDIMIEHKNPEISKEDIETLIHLGEQVSENEGIALIKEQKIREGRQKTTEYEMKLPPSIRKNAELIDQKLSNITVCDPAVGSGAFPVGMMSEIVKARKVLSIYHNSGLEPAVICSIDSECNTYNLKRQCIEHSLYGVDIDPGAVEIAKLRLWLSLMVDEEDFQQGASAPCHIKPLPNLDYKIVCGNSLLGVEKNLFNHQFFSDLEKLKPLYFNETNPTKKQNYKKQIDDLISRITNGHKEFDFEVYFSEVFHKKTVEKNWKAYHITWVTHGSRVSEKMVEFGAKTSDAIVLDEKSRLIISDVLAKKIKDDDYRVLALNVLSDHVHCVLVAEDHEISAIVQNLKGASSFEHNRQLQLSVQGEGRQTKLWAKGSSQTLLESEEHLLNAIEYVQNNHIKHDLSEVASSAHHRQMKQSVVGVDQAFAPITHPGGFDVVIANPPYISHEKIFIEKNVLKKQYQCYEPFADIYCYFIERGIRLQNKTGILSFITSNSYLRAEYGSPLRKLLRKENELLDIINLEGTQIFEDAIVNVAILLSTKSLASRKCFVFNQPFSGNISYFVEHITTKGFMYDQTKFDSKSWSLIKPEKVAIQHKIEKSGKSLKQLGTKIRLGLATGHNEAFIIDENKKNELIRQNRKNAEIIKPILRGRDIFRYYYESPDSYILLTKNGVKVQKDYPDIYKYLDGFGQSFKKRGAQGQHWTNLRATAFFDDFKEEKIVWIELTDVGRFAICTDEVYLLNTAYFLLPPPKINIKYLLGILNSKLIHFYLGTIAETSGMGVSRWINNYVKEFSIVQTSDDKQKEIIKLVDRILAAKGANPQADMSALEREIDQMVYELYGLTQDEIKIVEGRDEKAD